MPDSGKAPSRGEGLIGGCGQQSLGGEEMTFTFLPAESSAALRQRAAPRSYDEWRDKLPLPSFHAQRYGLISSTDSTTTTNILCHNFDLSDSSKYQGGI